MSPSCDNWGEWNGWASWHGQTWDDSTVSRDQRDSGESPWSHHPAVNSTDGDTYRNDELLQTQPASSAVSYYDAAAWNMVRATNIPPERPALDESPQIATGSNLQHDWPTSGAPLCHAQTPNGAGAEGLVQEVNGQTDHFLNTSCYHQSGDTGSEFTINGNSRAWRTEPTCPGPLAELMPRRQSPRFAGDEYTARWVRGYGTDRAGWCGFCSSWHKLKDSAYWYHMHYSHGISCATGKPFEAPQARRNAEGAVGFEVLCGCCNQWVYVGRLDRWQTPYYRHAYKCQMKNRFGVDRFRVGRPKSTSPRNTTGGVWRSI
ncbi:hypothetical protein CBER1_09439 [Cercospora berteroae]|uniref:Transcription regulator Rua1 C-terminal domain-containing protein n=1 Tax=Cercospora berteroae TaxID=357750 RepID=A0A2S6BWG2_9PEZI|nr:hypothetical protein CBER1_09439 [Cercospora berteroae]